MYVYIYKVKFVQDSKSRHRHRSGGLVNVAENQLPYTLHRINRSNVIPPNGRITLLEIRLVWIIIFLLIESGGVSPFLYHSNVVEFKNPIVIYPYS